MRLLWGNLVLSMFTLFTVLTLEGESTRLGVFVVTVLLGAALTRMLAKVAPARQLGLFNGRHVVRFEMICRLEQCGYSNC